MCLRANRPLAPGVRTALCDLRDRCLAFAAGSAPADSRVSVLRHDLWAQTPVSPAGEIDLAASGFALACLPSAVAAGVLSRARAQRLAVAAARRIAAMTTRSAAARTPAAIARDGCGGMLHHYPVWNARTTAFQGQPGVETSSIDTALLLLGLMVSASAFGGSVQQNFDRALRAIDWNRWIDTATPAHRHQIRMAYDATRGFQGWWDWYTHETMLLSILAAMSRPASETPILWNAWRRQSATYAPPGGPRFRCLSTWTGDPFTVTYGLHLLPLDRLGRDLNGVDWFREGRTAFRGHTVFFRRERGFCDGLVYSSFSDGPGLSIAEPKCSSDPLIDCAVAPVHALAGGLLYGAATPARNPAARTLAKLVRRTPGFYGPTGWPAATVVATDPAHPVASHRIVGQDLCATALAIDNYLCRRTQRLAMRNTRFRSVLRHLFPSAR